MPNPSSTAPTPRAGSAEHSARPHGRGTILLALALIVALAGTLALVGVAARSASEVRSEETSLITARGAVLDATARAYPINGALVDRLAAGDLRVRFAEAVEVGDPLEDVRDALSVRRPVSGDRGEIQRIDRAIDAIDEAGAAIRATRGVPPSVETTARVLRASAASRDPIGAWVGYSTRLLREQRAAGARQRDAFLRGIAAALIGSLALGIGLLVALRRDGRRTRQALLEAAMTDTLTQLRNQGAFHDRLVDEIARSRRTGAALSLILLDIDYFDRVNEAYGHRAGDAMLAEVGLVLAEAAREEDLVARIGGEDFVWLAVDCDGDGAMIVAARARAAIAGVHVQGVCAVTASAGVAEYEPDEDGEGFLRRAREALQQAKAGGRDRVYRVGNGAPAVAAGSPMPSVGVIRAP